MIEVVAALIVHRDQLLIAQRPPGDTLAYFWEFPGGKVQDGEDPIAALHREIEEELATSITVHRWLGSSTYEYPFGVVRVDLYLASLNADDPLRQVHHALAWVSPEHLRDYRWVPADLPLIEQIPRWLVDDSAPPLPDSSL